MSRIRTIKPEFFTSEDIMELPPLARLLYIALWCEADREGRLAYKPKTFKVRYLPSDECDIDSLLDALVTRGLLVVYASEGVKYAFIPSFLAHQHINPRETASQLPSPPENAKKSGSKKARVGHASTTRGARDSDAQGGREGKGIIIGNDASITRQFFGVPVPSGLLHHADAIQRWEAYKRKRQESYKSEDSAEEFLKYLASLPNPSEAIIHSMRMNWQGVFPPKDSKSQPQPVGGASKRVRTKEELEAAR